jgi:prefoldin subunit 5
MELTKIAEEEINKCKYLYQNAVFEINGKIFGCEFVDRETHRIDYAEYGPQQEGVDEEYFLIEPDLDPFQIETFKNAKEVIKYFLTVEKAVNIFTYEPVINIRNDTLESFRVEYVKERPLHLLQHLYETTRGRVHDLQEKIAQIRQMKQTLQNAEKWLDKNEKLQHDLSKLDTFSNKVIRFFSKSEREKYYSCQKNIAYTRQMMERNGINNRQDFKEKVKMLARQEAELPKLKSEIKRLKSDLKNFQKAITEVSKRNNERNKNLVKNMNRNQPMLRPTVYYYER